jgi:hypothetical protein
MGVLGYRVGFGVCEYRHYLVAGGRKGNNDLEV